MSSISLKNHLQAPLDGQSSSDSPTSSSRSSSSEMRPVPLKEGRKQVGNGRVLLHTDTRHYSMALEPIDQGAFGRVYYGDDLTAGVAVALKQLRSEGPAGFYQGTARQDLAVSHNEANLANHVGSALAPRNVICVRQSRWNRAVGATSLNRSRRALWLCA